MGRAPTHRYAIDNSATSYFEAGGKSLGFNFTVDLVTQRRHLPPD